jgi:hypothetical protein
MLLKIKVEHRHRGLPHKISLVLAVVELLLCPDDLLCGTRRLAVRLHGLLVAVVVDGN